jgi:hypothetical protein
VGVGKDRCGGNVLARVRLCYVGGSERLQSERLRGRNFTMVRISISIVLN